MPKRVRELEPQLSSPEADACFKKAKRAAGKHSRLTEDDLRLIATVAWDRGWLFRPNGNPDHDYTREDISGFTASFLAWAVATDCAAFARALGAAQKEAARIEATPIWAFRRAYRNLRFSLEATRLVRAGYGTFTKGTGVDRLDVQAIRQEAESMGCPNISSASDKTIHKAIAEEGRWIASTRKKT